MTKPMSSEEKRIITDRRKFSYTAYSPERRSGVDRRQQNQQQTLKFA